MTTDPKYKPCARCKKCYYGRATNMGFGKVFPLYSCDYYLITGKRRPCPAGPKCSVFNAKPKTLACDPLFPSMHRRDLA